VLQLRERGFLPAPRLGGPVRHHHELIPLKRRLDGVQVGEFPQAGGQGIVRGRGVARQGRAGAERSDRRHTVFSTAQARDGDSGEAEGGGRPAKGDHGVSDGGRRGGGGTRRDDDAAKQSPHLSARSSE
jgi:hypothetical protein